MFRLDGIRVHYGRRLALQIDSVGFEAGTSVAVMGPNGSGKTTMLRILAGLVEPSEGSVVTGSSRHPGVAYVAQHHHQHEWMPLTVGEVIRMGRYRERGLLRRLDRGDRQLLQDAAARLSIDDLLGRSFGELSGGQRQRVLVAGALASDASCLLLDEPITGLDLPSQQLILDVVDAERDRGRLVVLTTHHLDEARHCDRVLLLNTTVVADGAPGEVLTPAGLAEAFGPRMIGELDATDQDDGLIIVFDEHGHGHEHNPGGDDPPLGHTDDRAEEDGRPAPAASRGEP